MSNSKDSQATYLIRPNAKINWDLYITGALPSGYHSLDSIVAPIDLCDEIELSFEPGDAIEVHCEHFQGEENIVYKAIEAFKFHYPFKSKISVKIKKSIPHGAGLGGGSSDSASVLLRLNEHFGYPLSMERLVSVALTVGADVPNFFHMGWRRMTGIGETVTPAKGQNLELLLVVPDMPLQTKEVYSMWDKMCIAEIPPAYEFRMCSPYNSLQVASVVLCPEITPIVDTLLNLGAKKACMTGSGSVVFGWFENEKRADEALFCLSGRWKLIRTRTC